MNNKFKVHRISKGEYLYRGYKIKCVGYYEPDHHIAWEGYDEKMEKELLEVLLKEML